MTFFDKIYDQLFQSNNKPKQELVSEAIKRTEQERKAYFNWQNIGGYKPIFNQIFEAYQDKLQNKDSAWQVHLLQMSGANGFAVTYRNELGSQVFQHFFDLLKDKCMNLDYKLANADVRISAKKDIVETKERYYLKPMINTKNTEQLFDQKFGNILIEHILINDRPSYIKFTASIYSDHLYAKALSFEELMNEIFEQT
ncbi:MAG: hypothetical protein AAF363_08620 [Bacteroidota bacterium]